MDELEREPYELPANATYKERMVRVLIEKALSGHPRFMGMLLSYVMGSAEMKIEVESRREEIVRVLAEARWKAPWEKEG